MRIGMINMILLIMMIMMTAFVLRGKDENWCSIHDLITRHLILLSSIIFYVLIFIAHNQDHNHNHHDYQP